MSALGQKRTFWPFIAMSALPPKADIDSARHHVRFGGIEAASLDLDVTLRCSIGCVLVPTNTNTCTPARTPAPSVIAGTDCGCTRGRGTIVRTPMYSAVDTSNAHWC
jgi:hypothetical protein